LRATAPSGAAGGLRLASGSACPFERQHDLPVRGRSSGEIAVIAERAIRIESDDLAPFREFILGKALGCLHFFKFVLPLLHGVALTERPGRARTASADKIPYVKHVEPRLCPSLAGKEFQPALMRPGIADRRVDLFAFVKQGEFKRVTIVDAGQNGDRGEPLRQLHRQILQLAGVDLVIVRVVNR
jgi:hypothetical protein